MAGSVGVSLVFRDLDKFADDADLKKWIVDYAADAIVTTVSQVRGVATKAGDVAITDRSVSIGITIGGTF